MDTGDKLHAYFCTHGASTLQEISTAVGLPPDEVKRALETPEMCKFRVYSKNVGGTVKYNSTKFAGGSDE